MKLLLAAVLSLLASNADALNTTSGGGGCTTDCTFTSVITNGPAPSLTATGAAINGQLKVSSSSIITDGSAGELIVDRSQASDAAGSGSAIKIIGNGGGAYTLLSLFKGASAMGYFGYGNSGSILNGAGTASVSLRAENSLHFGAGGSNLIMTLLGGNVGIGTASPAYKLHTSSGEFYLDGNSAGVIIDRSQAVDGAGSGYPLKIIGSGAGSYSIIPFFKGATAMAYLGYGNAGSILTGANTGSFAIRAENDLHFGASGNNLTATVTGGKVGIGTTSPATKLDLAGDAQFGSGVNKATITAGGFWQPLSQTTLQASLLAPTSLGQYIHNSTINELCKSTGPLAGNWQKVDGGGGCF